MKFFSIQLLFISLTFFSVFSCKSQDKTSTKKVTKSSKNIELKSSLVDSAQIMADIKFLASDELAGRKSGEKGNEIARQYIVNKFQKIGLEKFDTSYTQPFRFYKRFPKKTYHGQNIIGKITGTEFPEKYLVLTAHYDHIGQKNEKIFNGADDNASGVSALLATAQYFKNNPPKHSIIFVAFDAEELGLEGAKYFVDEPPVELEKLVMNVNLDMISRNKKNEIYICGTYHYPFLKEKLGDINAKTKLNVLFGHDTPNLGFNDWTNASDHGPFHQKKIPFVYLGVEDHEDYHKETDTFERIDPSFLFQSTQLVIKMMEAFDQ